MIKGVGVDIVENNRFSTFPHGALEKIFTRSELLEMERRVNKTEYLASRFAGTGFRGWSAKDIETGSDEGGRPFVLVKGKRDDSIHLSLSHEKGYSIAFVVLEEV